MLLFRLVLKRDEGNKLFLYLKSVRYPVCSLPPGLSRQPGVFPCALVKILQQVHAVSCTDAVFSQVSCWQRRAILEPFLSPSTFGGTSAHLPTVPECREDLPRWRCSCHQQQCQRLCSTPLSSPSVLSLSVCPVLEWPD